jgi:plasmid stability protein
MISWRTLTKEAAMATLTIRALDPDVKQGLRERAARHSRSMEAEVRDILTREVLGDLGSPDPEPTGAVLVEALAALQAEFSDLLIDGVFDDVRSPDLPREAGLESDAA